MDKVTAASSICFTWVIQKCDIENVQESCNSDISTLCRGSKSTTSAFCFGETRQHTTDLQGYDGNHRHVTTVAPMGSRTLTCTAVQLEKVSSGSRHCPWLRPTWILPEIIPNAHRNSIESDAMLKIDFEHMSVWWPCDFRIEFIALQTVTIGGSWYIRMFSVCRNPNGSFNCQGWLVSF